MNEKEILKIEHLQKGYRNHPVLKDVSFALKQGHILGLIGKNGAGKTTLMKSILGLNTDYTGQISFFGKPLGSGGSALREQTGSLVDVVFYEDMTARRNLKLLSSLSGLSHDICTKQINELLDFVGLSSSADKNVRTFSFGMKQRLALAQSLLTNPDLLILDEPFVGLDPVGIEDTKHLLLTLCREQNTSIIFSSHQLNEVCDLADDIIILSEGFIKVSDTYKNLENSGVSFIDLLR